MYLALLLYYILEPYVIDLRPLFFYNIGVQCNKFSPMHCLICIPQILLCCAFISIQLKTFSNLFCDVFFSLWALKIFPVQFPSNLGLLCYAYVIGLSFNAVTVRKPALYDFSPYKFLGTCFKTQHRVCLHGISNFASGHILQYDVSDSHIHTRLSVD